MKNRNANHALVFRPNLFIVEQRFDWISEDKATSILFYVTAIEKALFAGKLKVEHILTPILPAVAEQWRQERELNVAHALSLSTVRLAIPCLGVIFPDGEVLTIDGTHRYYACYRRGVKDISFNLVTYADVKPYFTLKGKPL